MAAPLAQRLRPKTLDEMVGQEHLLGPGGLLRRTLRLLLLPGLGLLLRLHGRLHLVLRNERLARLDGLALPLPEIGGYPLHLLFRHTEEVEAGRVFQLVPEVGKEI